MACDDGNERNAAQVTSTATILLLRTLRPNSAGGVHAPRAILVNFVQLTFTLLRPNLPTHAIRFRASGRAVLSPNWQSLFCASSTAQVGYWSSHQPLFYGRQRT